MISNGMMRNTPEVEKTELKIKDENTTQTQTCENNVDIHKESDTLGLSSLLTGLTSLMMPSISLHEIKELDDCYHDLNARLMVVEKLVDCLIKKGL